MNITSRIKRMTVTFDKKLAELDAYLQMLIEQSELLDNKIELANSDIEREGLDLVKKNLETLLGSIKHAIVLLQIAKVSIKPYSSNSSLNSSSTSLREKKPSITVERQLNRVSPKPPARAPKRQAHQTPQQQSQRRLPPRSQLASPETGALQAPHKVQPTISPQLRPQSQTSRQSSNGDDSGVVSQLNNLDIDSTVSSSKLPFDQTDINKNLSIKADDIFSRSHQDEAVDDDEEDFYDAPDEQQQANESTSRFSQHSNQARVNNNQYNSTSVDSSVTMANNNFIEETSIDWDALYEEEEEDLGSLENQGSVIKHLISQIRIGMDLTKVVLPTFILERRSLLEMYADFFAHPDLFSSIPDYNTPEERMVQLVKWYLSAFHAGRKSSVAKKPYNPILGEIFLCHWNLDGSSSKSQNSERQGFTSSVERANSTESTSSIGDIEKFSNQLPNNSLLFVAEQVSHHPPVSAFYTENPEKQISCCAHIYTKSKYLGLSVGVHNVGQGVIKLHKHDETYICTFPSAFGRSILTVPWVELGGSVNITCKETGYAANIEFVTKPFYGGKKHRVIGEIFRPNKEPFMAIDGEWNGCMYSKSPPNSSVKEVFVDTTCLPVIKKNVRSISAQESFESRFVWKEVTRALKLHDVTSATAAKSFIEQRQRDSLKERQEKGASWKARYFENVEDGWTYAKPLEVRLSRIN